jgi:hypothetical protein
LLDSYRRVITVEVKDLYQEITVRKLTPKITVEHNRQKVLQKLEWPLFIAIIPLENYHREITIKKLLQRW